MAIKDYSATADDNVTIGGINIAEGCPPSGINNAIRRLMADVKTADFGTTAPKADAIAESTSGSGVTVDGLLIKDGALPGFNPVPTADATGTVNAITATYSPAVTLADKTIVSLTCAGANTSTTPTFAPNGLTARTIVKENGQPLLAGDIPGAGYVAVLQYDLANTRWVLLNPSYKPYADSGLAKVADSGLAKVAVGTFTRNLTAASGNVAYTGVGFTPRVVHFIAGVNNTRIMSFGFAGSGGIGDINLTGFADSYSVLSEYAIIAVGPTVSDSQVAQLSSYDSDGFTLTWSKNGTPGAGTLAVSYLAIR